MERRESSRVNTRPTHRQLILWTLGYTLVAFVLLSMQRDASAANLVDVRVGEHGGYTRVVLELDSLAAYQVSEPRDDRDAVMRVALDARGGSRNIEVSDAIVSGIRIEAKGSSTAVLVHLSKAAVQINEMILLSPPRLVFDIRDPARAAAPTRPAAKKRAKAGSASARKPPAKPVAKIEPAPEENAKPATALVPTPRAEAPTKRAEVIEAPPPGPAAKRPGIVPGDVRTEAASGAAPVARRADPTGASAATAMASNEKDGELADPSHAAAPAQSAIEAVRLAQAGRDAQGAAAHPPGASLPVGAANAGRPNSLAPPSSTAGANAPAAGQLAVPPLPSQRSSGSTPVAAKTGLLSKVTAFVSGLNKMILGGVGLLAVLAIFFMMRRGRGSDDALSPVMAADDLGADGDDLFARPDSGPSEMEATEPIPTERSAAAPPPPVSAPAGGNAGGGLEGRVAQLEGALAQLTQSRENMERQIAAQTEELRVQRAAIARTQRVVRSFGEGDEEQGATEPVPRAPAS